MGSIVEKHLSRLASPNSWKISKKNFKWIVRPLPGAHPLKEGIPLLVIFRDILGYAHTMREVKKILSNDEIYIDGKRRKELKFIVGLMDILFIPKTKEGYRLLFTKRGSLALVPIDENELGYKLCKITGKRLVAKRFQLNLFDGRNILLDKAEYKVGDTLLLEVPSMKIKESFAMEKGSQIYLTGGKHIGEIGVLQEMNEKTITIKKGKELIKTSKEHAFVVGKEKPLIKIVE
jgi:small subunit ribosomal protein S4e